MGFLGLFKKKPPTSGRISPTSLDPELRGRLRNIAAANTLVRGGQDPQRLMLAINFDADDKIDADRPTMRFQFEAQRVGENAWRFAAGIDEATSYCRFTMDLELPAQSPLDPATFDIANAPFVRLTFSKPPDHERSPLARSAFLLSWRINGGMERPLLDAPLAVDVGVMGVELTRLDAFYVPTVEAGEQWALLKCNRGEQSFWLGLELSSGAGEVFPRRGEVASYELALDFLCTFT